MFFWHRTNTRRSEEIEKTVASATVETVPVPYLYASHLLTPSECDAISQHWPARKAMADEGAGLDRSFLEFITDDTINFRSLPRSLAPFWKAQLRGPITAIYRGLATAFAPYIAAKFGSDCPDTINLQIHRLMCLEAEKGFVEHTPHSHAAAPNWVFTFLLYIDDIGREDRGTSLYRPVDLDFDNQLGNVLSGSHGKLDRVYDAPFRRGSLFAFFDCPLSVHGSTPFHGESADCSRRIIRSHVSLGPREVERIYGRQTADLNAAMSAACQRYAETRSVAAYDGFALSDDIALMRKLHLRQDVPARPVAIALPALD